MIDVQHNGRDRMSIKQLHTAGRHGRVPAVGIDDRLWIIDDLGQATASARVAPAVSALRQTKPIGPLRIGDWRLGIRGRTRRAGPTGCVRNKPNLPHLATWRAAIAAGGRDTRHASRDARNSRREIRARCVDAAPNKPNHSICCGPSCAGHYISKASRRERETKPIGAAATAAIGDWRFGIGDSTTRGAATSCRRCAKQSQSWPRRPRH
jgi:hypothetical protein